MTQPSLDLGNRRSSAAAARFFVRIGQTGRAAESRRDPISLPLFPLPLILEAEGLARKSR